MLCSPHNAIDDHLFLQADGPPIRHLPGETDLAGAAIAEAALREATREWLLLAAVDRSRQSLTFASPSPWPRPDKASYGR